MPSSVEIVVMIAVHAFTVSSACLLCEVSAGPHVDIGDVFTLIKELAR